MYDPKTQYLSGLGLRALSGEFPLQALSWHIKYPCTKYPRSLKRAFFTHYTLRRLTIAPNPNMAKTKASGAFAGESGVEEQEESASADESDSSGSSGVAQASKSAHS